MNIGYYIIISVYLVSMFCLLHKYAVGRAKYLVSLELGSINESMAEDEIIGEPVPNHRPESPAWISCGVT